MGKLPTSQTKHLVLPSTKDKPAAEQEWVDLKTEPTGGDLVVVLSDVQELSTAGERSMAALAGLITKWSYVDDEGNPLPITRDNVQRLGFLDLNFLGEQIAPVIAAMQKMLEEGTIQEKKDVTSSSPSATPVTAPVPTQPSL